MLPLDRHTLDLLALSAAGAGGLGLILGLVAQLRLGRLRRRFAVLDGPDGRETVLDAVHRQEAEVAALRQELSAARGDVDRARGDLADAIRHVAVVRYDAFGDMGGRLSFSAALLDDAGDGVVFTSINGRSETRTYAKGVKAGASELALSPEESQAIEAAMSGRLPREARGRHAGSHAANRVDRPAPARS